MAKDKTLSENKALIEQSVDIDEHLSNFKKDMLSNQLSDEKYELEEAYRQKLKDASKKMAQDLSDQRDLIAKNYQKKLDNERNKLQKQQQRDFSALQDKKEQVRKQAEQKIRDFKRKQERDFSYQKNQVVEKVNDYISDEQSKIKLNTEKHFKSKLKRIDEQVKKAQENTKIEADHYELDTQDEVSRQ